MTFVSIPLAFTLGAAVTLEAGQGQRRGQTSGSTKPRGQFGPWALSCPRGGVVDDGSVSQFLTAA